LVEWERHETLCQSACGDWNIIARIERFAKNRYNGGGSLPVVSRS
jgi:hypothetical protein